MPGETVFWANQVKETSTTTGTGAYSLAGADAGFRTFVAAIGNGNYCPYSASDGTNWEQGLGGVTDGSPDTLSRDFIMSSSNSGAAVDWGAGTKTIVCTLLAHNLFPRGHIWGLGLTNAADAANDITIAHGECCSEDGNFDMHLRSPITKRLDAAWAVGSDNGGLNTGGEAANTWYEVHLIKRVDTGVVDAMFTTTANRGTLPSGYLCSRRIGWIRNDGSSNILAFTQVDDHFTLTTPVNDVSTTSSATAASRTLTVPPSTIARLRVSALGNTNVNAANAVVFSELVETDTAPTTSNGFNSIGAGDFAIIGAGHIELRVDGSSQIRDRSITATGSMAYDISTFGWIDRRGRLGGT
jgi:hypothetical protein